jgi:hypothetical protein
VYVRRICPSVDVLRSPCTQSGQAGIVAVKRDCAGGNDTGVGAPAVYGGDVGDVADKIVVSGDIVGVLFVEGGESAAIDDVADLVVVDIDTSWLDAEMDIDDAVDVVVVDDVDDVGTFGFVGEKDGVFVPRGVVVVVSDVEYKTGNRKSCAVGNIVVKYISHCLFS